MAIINKLPEAERRNAILAALGDVKREFTPERRKELEDEVSRLDETIRINTQKLLDKAHAGIIPTMKIIKQEENNMADENTDWPKDAKLVKQRVALVEDELKAKIEEICKNDDKVIVSVLGKVLKDFREGKKSKKPAPVAPVA